MKKIFRKSIAQKVAAGLAVVSLGASNANAALAAADVDMTGAQDDVTLVFKAILGVVVIIFGFAMVRKTLG